MSYQVIEQKEEEVLKYMIFIEPNFVAIGKTNGIISIYDILEKKQIFSGKFCNGTIAYLLIHKKEKNTYLISCSDEPVIIVSDITPLISKDYNFQSSQIMQSKIYSEIHKSYIKKIEYVNNDNFASCSLDGTIMNINFINKQCNPIIIDNAGIENFFIIFKKNSLDNIITLNKKCVLSFYIKHKDKFYLKKIILDIDYTNSNSLKKIKDKLYIGGYKFLQIISIKEMEIIARIKLENPISFIYNSSNGLTNNFLIFGLKNGKLEFLDKNKFNKLKNDKIVEIEKKNINFKFSNIMENENIILFENKPIISFEIFEDKLICISDNYIKIYEKCKINKISPINTINSINAINNKKVNSGFFNYFSSLLNVLKENHIYDKNYKF